MKLFPLTLIIIIWLCIMTYKKNKSTRLDKQASERFWQKERNANLTRKSSLENLTYIIIPLEDLPFQDTNDKKLLAIQHTIKDLASKDIVNLTGISNTELKLQYGAPNINILTEFDNNFTLLARTINQWGEYLYNQQLPYKAITILEYGISIKTDIKNNFLLLAKLYSETNQSSKIENLIEKANQLNTILKQPIITSLKQMHVE